MLRGMNWLLRDSVARRSRPICIHERVEKAPFAVILAIVNAVEGCKSLKTLAIISLTNPQDPIFLAILGTNF